MDQCPSEPHGAFPKGTRVEQIRGDADDVHVLGTMGTVAVSVCHPATSEIGYLTDWDSGVQGFIIAQKVERIAGST
jgi:hypothetical protein